jgi:hypothetical protein
VCRKKLQTNKHTLASLLHPSDSIQQQKHHRANASKPFFVEAQNQLGAAFGGSLENLGFAGGMHALGNLCNFEVVKLALMRPQGNIRLGQKIDICAMCALKGCSLPC